MRRFRPWYRHDAKGMVDGRRCMLCVHFADRAYKTKGGRKILSGLSGQTKTEFKTDLQKFLTNLTEGKISQAAQNLGTTISLSKDTSLVVETAWDFVPKSVLEHTGGDVNESDLRTFKTNDGVKLRGIWRKALKIVQANSKQYVKSEILHSTFGRKSTRRKH